MFRQVVRPGMRSIRPVVGNAARSGIHISLGGYATIARMDIPNTQTAKDTVARRDMGSIMAVHAINVSRDTTNTIQVPGTVAKTDIPTSMMECATSVSKDIIRIRPVGGIAVRPGIHITVMGTVGRDPGQDHHTERGIRTHTVIVPRTRIVRGTHMTTQRSDMVWQNH